VTAEDVEEPVEDKSSVALDENVVATDEDEVAIEADEEDVKTELDEEDVNTEIDGEDATTKLNEGVITEAGEDAARVESIVANGISSATLTRST